MDPLEPFSEIILNAMGVAIVVFFGVRFAKMAIFAAMVFAGN